MNVCKYSPNEMSMSYEKYLTSAPISKPRDERKKDFSNENLYILEVNLGVTAHFTTSQTVVNISAAPAILEQFFNFSNTYFLWCQDTALWEI